MGFRAGIVLTLVAVATVLAPSGARADVVLYLPLDDGPPATTATDVSGNGLDGTLMGMSGTSEWVPGIAGSALDFDGSNDWVSVPDSPALDFGTGDFSVSFWVRKQSPTSNFDNNFGVGKWSSGTNFPGENEWILTLGTGTSSNRPQFVLEVGTNQHSVQSPTGIFDNPTPLWHHLVGVRDGTTLRLYLDGVLVAQNTSLPVGTAVNNQGRLLSIAANTQPNSGTTGIAYSDALFDDVRVFNHALTGAEVAELFNNPGVEVPEPGGVALLVLAGGLLVGWRQRTR